MTDLTKPISNAAPRTGRSDCTAFVFCAWIIISYAFHVHAQGLGEQSSNLGSTADGRQVHAYVLRNKTGSTAKLMDLGATILEVNVPDRTGAYANVVLELKDIASYETIGPINSIVGRYANRIANGFDLDGRHYPLVQNKRGVTLHGGTAPYSNRIWRTIPTHIPNSVTFGLDSPDGDQGFPGKVSVEVTYTLTDRNELRIDYLANTDKQTVVNLTNHIYFNLSGCSGCSALDHQLQVFADKFTPVDANSVPTGEERSVDGTALDFRKMTTIGRRIGPATTPDLSTVRGYDNNMIVNPGHTKVGKTAGKLYDPKTGRILIVETTEPAIQVFSAGGMREGVPTADGGKLVKSAGIAMETQHFPDSPNHPNFPSTLLSPGKPFHSTTVFKFITDKDRP